MFYQQIETARALLLLLLLLLLLVQRCSERHRYTHNIYARTIQTCDNLTVLHTHARETRKQTRVSVRYYMVRVCASAPASCARVTCVCLLQESRGVRGGVGLKRRDAIDEWLAVVDEKPFAGRQVKYMYMQYYVYVLYRIDTVVMYIYIYIYMQLPCNLQMDSKVRIVCIVV